MSSVRGALMPQSFKWIACGILIAAMTVDVSGCKKPATTATQSVPEVSVTDVIQRDATTYSDWVGTTQGFLNADIYPKIAGYLLKQNYPHVDLLKTEQFLFQLNPPYYQPPPHHAL